MRINPFKIERWFAKYEFQAKYNIAESCANPLTMEEIMSMDVDFKKTLTEMSREILNFKFGYTESNGTPNLRKRIQENFYPYADFEKNILVTMGASEANYLILQNLIEPGDEVIAQLPSYNQHYEVPRALGAKVKFWELKEEKQWSQDLEDLRPLLSKHTKLVIITNPHNPTGSILDKKDLQDLIDLAEEFDFYILSDEVFKGLNLFGKDTSHRAFNLNSQRVISVSDMSKAFALSGLRLGWMVGPQWLIESCVSYRDYTSICNVGMAEILADIALKHYKTILDRNDKIARVNYAIIEEFFKKHSEKVDHIPPAAGVLIFPKLKLNLSTHELAENLVKKHSVLIVPGSCFDMEGYFRMGFGYGTENLKEGLSLFSKFLDNL